MASVGLSPAEINQKVHELYITNTTTFAATPKVKANRGGAGPN